VCEVEGGDPCEKKRLIPESDTEMGRSRHRLSGGRRRQFKCSSACASRGSCGFWRRPAKGSSLLQSLKRGVQNDLRTPFRNYKLAGMSSLQQTEISKSTQYSCCCRYRVRSRTLFHQGQGRTQHISVQSRSCFLLEGNLFRKEHQTISSYRRRRKRCV
jgi:hypothetical protein